ncbi:hypothetical protein AMTRI_Chr10g4580 [Amborella trichopoda]
MRESLPYRLLFLVNHYNGIIINLTGIKDSKRSKPIKKLGTQNTCCLLSAYNSLRLDPSTAKLPMAFLGPSLSAFGFLLILRIVMSWYPKLPVGKFIFVIAYSPTEPLGHDSPVVWFGLMSFLNEILVGPQGHLVLLSQQVIDFCHHSFVHQQMCDLC